MPIVTDHARLRYRQRVDATPESVDERLREMFRCGRPVQRRDANGATVQYEGYIVVYIPGDRPVIKSVLLAGPGGDRRAR